MRNENRPVIYTFKDRRLHVDGFGGIPRLLSQIDEISLSTKERESLRNFITVGSNFIDLIFSLGAVVTNRGDILGHGKEHFAKYPKIEEIFKGVPAFSRKKAHATFTGYTNPQLIQFKDGVNVHFIGPKADRKVKSEGGLLFLPVPSDPGLQEGMYSLRLPMQALAHTLEDVRTRVDAPDVIPNLTIVEEAVHDMAILNHKNVPQIPQNL